jgi:uracil-DNA glycosylase
MILGHNYGNDLDFTRNIQSAETSWRDSVWPTCRNTWAALHRWGIDPASCFFTNFFPGYVTTRDPNGKPFNVGPHPHARNAAFVRTCREFFVRQVQTQRPRAVLVLGAEVPQLLAPLDPRLRAWSPWPTFTELDASGTSIVRGLTLGGVTFNMCVVTHPSMPNATHRRYGHLQGKKAEDAIVRATVIGME